MGGVVARLLRLSEEGFSALFGPRTDARVTHFCGYDKSTNRAELKRDEGVEPVCVNMSSRSCGKARGKVEGGLAEISTWGTCILETAKVPGWRCREVGEGLWGDEPGGEDCWR
ncbi:hypothetical protein GSI_07610 [Ganoderma sinense ZZ0214-1]|uniref:Uncharacterized protein n=1 Tax=Ganoderma sinense ZZ0214-1 TaxID=1077348 RepID=A0A2G8S9H8_9APHY|nr:hypothetical protein GSI_07610 [Ganoderma sinense ZZ0214-1]